MSLLRETEEALIISLAAKIFFTKPISEITIKEIAFRVGVGEATIYRKFGNKYNIVIAVAKHLSDEVFAKYFYVDEKETGFESIKRFYETFLKVFEKTPEYYRFISEFDAFVISNNTSIKSYEAGIEAFWNLYASTYKRGIEDGTLKNIDNLECFYFATTHSLMGLCKKLAGVNVLDQDARINKPEEIQVFIDTILYRIEKI